MSEIKPDILYSEDEITHCINPLLEVLRSNYQADKTLVVAIQGGQGTGKTTFARYLLQRLSGYSAISFSIDDLYTSRGERQALAARYPDNPYYQIARGMPGTHRTDFLYDVLSGLKHGDDVDIPVFDKSAYNGYGDISDEVVRVRGKQDIVMLEGWCVGMPETTSADVIDICKGQGLWEDSPLYEARYIDEVLSHAGAYQKIWGLFDIMIMLRPDLPEFHYKWRREQERDLVARSGSGMLEGQVDDFVHTFLPFTYLCYERILADISIRIDAGHRFHSFVSHFWRP